MKSSTAFVNIDLERATPDMDIVDQCVMHGITIVMVVPPSGPAKWMIPLPENPIAIQNVYLSQPEQPDLSLASIEQADLEIAARQAQGHRDSAEYTVFWDNHQTLHGLHPLIPVRNGDYSGFRHQLFHRLRQEAGLFCPGHLTATDYLQGIERNWMDAERARIILAQYEL